MAWEAKIKVIRAELQLQLKSHEQLVSDWSEDIAWLWSRCQPSNNQHSISEWDSLIQRIQHTEPQTRIPELDEAFEDAVLNVNVEDGEDVEEPLLLDEENET